LPNRLTRGFSVDDLKRIERLFHLIEAASMPLALYGNVNRKIGRYTWIAGSFVALWLSVFAVALSSLYFKNQLSSVSDHADVGPLQVKTSDSRLAETELRVPIARQNSRSAIFSPKSKRVTVRLANAKHLLPDSRLSGAEPVRSNMGSTNLGAALTNTILPKLRNQVSDFRPTPSALAHKRPDGTLDYWIIPRGPFFDSPARVVPFGKNSNGVFVRNLEDGHNYRLTPAGDWFVLIPPP
jgi:hypothetical protein